MKALILPLTIICIGSILFVNCDSAQEKTHPEIEINQIASLPFEVDIQDFIQIIDQEDFTIAYDPFFGPGTIFQGYSVNKGLISMGADKLATIDSLEIIFICKDGYAPSMPLAEFLKRDAFILPQKEADLVNWPEKVRKKVLPYYITFTDAKTKERLPYPYGTVKIKIDYIANQHEFSFPTEIQNDSLLSKGFKLFQHRCGKCHSINKEGGKVGPELNYPKNITEYRSKEYLVSFIRNPRSYRYNSSMSPMKIEDDQLELILGYLKEMKNHKIQ